VAQVPVFFIGAWVWIQESRGPRAFVIVGGPFTGAANEIRWEVRSDTGFIGHASQSSMSPRAGGPSPPVADLDDPPAPPPIPPDPPPPPPPPDDDANGDPPGADTRDDPPEGDPVSNPPGGRRVMGVASAIALLPAVMRILAAGFFRFFARGSRIAWGRIPGWLQNALVAAGVLVGTELVMDIGDNTGSNGPPPDTDIVPMPPIPPISAGPPGVVVIGGWVANNVVFYRLSDGRIAVQNKHGRWKIWRPKKPIVLMPTGAGNLRTLLRADAVLNRQAKQIKRMLDRRAASRPRKPRVTQEKTIVVAQDGSKVTQI